MRTKAEILELVEQEDVEFIRLQFTDMFGDLKNVAITANQFSRALDNKYAFDGAAMFGMQANVTEDLYLSPDLDTFVILPWRPQHGKVARLLCDVYRADGTEYVMSPRTILKNVVDEAAKKGYTFYIDPDCEFFLFHTDDNGLPTTVTHEQAGYMDVGPIDLGENARRDMVLSLEQMGFEVQSSHHESAPAQHEIDFKEEEPLKIADSVVTFKSAVRSIAKRFGLHATFMPKPKKGVPGSGMHLNISMYKDGRNLFNVKDGQDYSDEAKWFMAGVLEYAKAMCSVTNPLVNSYKRIIWGFGQTSGDKVADNQREIMKVRRRLGEDTKIEVKFPDPSANPYLAIALCLAAGLDGIDRKLELGSDSMIAENKDTRVGYLPMSLREAVGYTREETFVREVLGNDFVDIYCNLKSDEWDEYMEQVSDWELNKYLNRV